VDVLIHVWCNRDAARDGTISCDHLKHHHGMPFGELYGYTILDLLIIIIIIIIIIIVVIVIIIIIMYGIPCISVYSAPQNPESQPSLGQFK
jgi:hypothetical protein